MAKGRILVIEDTGGIPMEEHIDNITQRLRGKGIMNEHDIIFWQASNINRIYWVSDNWFNKIVNSWRLKRTMKQIKKHG